MDRSKYEQIFDQESGRYLQDLDDLLLKVEKEADNRELWGDIHGKIHSIKGMARALSLEKITTLSHLMEAWCKAYQEGSVGAVPTAIQAIYDGTDCLRYLVARKGGDESFEDQQRYSSLVALFEKAPHAPSGEKKPALPTDTAQKTQVQSISEVRVRYSLIEELLGLAQEIQLLEKTLPPLPQGQEFSGVKNWMAHCTSLMKVMYFRLAHLRLMSVGDFADLFNKTVRNLAASYGKKVCFSVEGGEIAADITILERLREPLVHIFRNCIAHGIEYPEERIKAGKSEEG
ncbi:MAG: Hpt domain-containing protein, partial [Desulfobulbaceae bacterium]|nr:Hpt domain-containing protein [Desulfobulbaceae bacterium]